MAFGNSFSGGVSGGSGVIADGSITAVKLASGAVITAKILDANITSAKLASDAVTTAKIADANITPAKLSGAQSGSAPAYAARAWVNFNGTGTVAIRASGNVSSITDDGVGLWTINFTTPMQDANYSAVVQHDHQSSFNRGIGLTSTYSASSFQVSSEDKAGTFGSSRTDSSTISVAVFR